MTEQQWEELGKKIANELRLKKSIEFPDRYNLRSGTKTNIGLAKTIVRLIQPYYDDLYGKEY